MVRRLVTGQAGVNLAKKFIRFGVRVQCVGIWTGYSIELDATGCDRCGAGVVSSLTDWFFAGDWIHRRYSYPEIWRQGSEGRAIALTSPLPFLTCGIFAYVTTRMGIHSVSGAVKLAVAVWLIAPLPLILTNAAFMKLHRVFAALRNRLANKTHNCCSGGRLLPSLMPTTDRSATGSYLAAPKAIGTSSLSAASTLNIGCGVTFMKLAMNVSGIC